MYDLLIKDGTVVDGSGSAGYRADVAVQDGKIAAIGRLNSKARQTIDAEGHVVSPGFVDGHTHMDAQVFWDPLGSCSCYHGVTSVVMGNCGFTLAPCKQEDADLVFRNLERAEDLSRDAMLEGIDWTWETFPQFLDAVDALPKGINYAGYIGHSALRTYVMGERAVRHEQATPEECQQMGQIAAAGIKAGALGFSTSRTINHRTLAGEYTPTLRAAEEELAVIGENVGHVGAGWLQVISDFDDPDAEFAMLKRINSRAKRPMAITILQRDSRPELWRDLMAGIAQANKEGAQILGQVLTRPTGILLGFEISMNPFSGRPSWEKIAKLSMDEKLVHLRDPSFRKQVMGETCPAKKLAGRVSTYERIFPWDGVYPDYEPPANQSVAARAEREGRDPEDLVYDLLLEKEGKTIPVSYTHLTLPTNREV